MACRPCLPAECTRKKIAWSYRATWCILRICPCNAKSFQMLPMIWNAVILIRRMDPKFWVRENTRNNHVSMDKIIAKIPKRHQIQDQNRASRFLGLIVHGHLHKKKQHPFRKRKIHSYLRTRYYFHTNLHFPQTLTLLHALDWPIKTS
jgi:hypothetical protein